MSSTSPTDREMSSAELAKVSDDEERLLLATGRYLGEGFDDVRLDTLFIAMPVSWRGRSPVYRASPSPSLRKGGGAILDYVGRDVPMLVRMFEKRLRPYGSRGFARGGMPIDTATTIPEYTFEYDEEVTAGSDDIS